MGRDDHGVEHRRRIALLIRDLVNTELGRSEDFLTRERVDETKRTVLEILADLERNDVWYDFRLQMRDAFLKIDNLLFLIFIFNNHSEPIHPPNMNHPSHQSSHHSRPPTYSSISNTTYMRVPLTPDLTTRMKIKAEYQPYVNTFVDAFAKP